MFEIIKKHKIFIGVMISLIFIGVPVVMHIFYKYVSDLNSIFSEWNESEILNYYGAILSCIGTVSLGALALYQNDIFKKQSDKIMQLQNVPYFSHVHLLGKSRNDGLGVVVNSSSADTYPAGVFLWRENANNRSYVVFNALNMSDYPICRIEGRIQGYNKYEERWITVKGEGCYDELKIPLPPKQEREIYIGYEHKFDEMQLMGFSKRKFAIQLDFTNTNGLTTQGRIIIEADKMVCEYMLLPLPISIQSEDEISCEVE